MDDKGGCNCFQAAWVDHALRKKKSGLHQAKCPVCFRIFSTNREGSEVICSDCGKGLRHKVEVLGIGGKQYNDILHLVMKAVVGTEFKVISITDVDTIKTYNVSLTPAVVVDGKVKCEGTIPEYEDICDWIGRKH